MEGSVVVHSDAFFDFFSKLQNSMNDSLKILRQEKKDSEFRDGAISKLELSISLVTKILEKYKEEGIMDSALGKEILSTWTQSTLDSTFIQETELVESDFPKEKKATFFQIIDILEGVKLQIINYNKVMHKNNFVDFVDEKRKIIAQVKELIGSELCEVLHWRKGALFYMFIATIISNHREDELELKMMEECIKELELMLMVRDEDVYDTKNQDNNKLMSQGIFSSTHLLAIMYAGEVAYWIYMKMGVDLYKEKALNFLSTYEKIVDNLPPYNGWNSNKSKELQHLLKQ